MTCARIIINVVSQSPNDVVQPLVEDGVRKTFSQREIKHIEKGGERELVHVVDHRHLREHEKQDGATSGGWAVPRQDVIKQIRYV